MTLGSRQEQSESSVSEVPEHIYFSLDVCYGLGQQRTDFCRHIAVLIWVDGYAEKSERERSFESECSCKFTFEEKLQCFKAKDAGFSLV